MIHKRAGLRKACLSLVLIVTAYAAAPVNHLGQEAARAPAPGPDNEYLVGSTLWSQTSGEARALSYQAYNLAHLLLDQDLRQNRRRRQRPRAVIVDVDDTVLDNSPYQATIIRNRQSYPLGWTEWINRAQAEALPGAVDFLKYAASRGVRVFYVTNRKPEEKAGTAQNLKKLGFPNVTDETLLVRPASGSTNKEERRRNIANRFRVVLLIGDNLNDFAELFENAKTVTARQAAADHMRAEFGTRFIMLPNPMYGDWESAVYDYNFKLSDAEKAAKRRSLLRPIE